jgi:Cu/Ag efflux pump CusA
MRVYDACSASRWNTRWVLALFSALLIAGTYLCYTNTGSDLLPEMDEGGFIVDYIMPAGLFAGGDQSRGHAHREDSARHSGSGKRIAPHRPAIGPGAGDGSQYRAIFR